MVLRASLTSNISYFPFAFDGFGILTMYINNCRLAASESIILAKLFSKTAQQLSQENPGHDLLDEIERYLAAFRKRPLPKTRSEFETRATLLQLLRDLQTFIELKVSFYTNYKEEQAS